ncbi:MAG: hypothetical protein PUB53_08690, partial [Bacteroidales bacterium]|nr:hypothetical protein [Bacteroidales bacterium]
ERSLSYSKIVQVSAKQKKTPQDFRLLGRTQPILFKDSASERKEPSLLELFAERSLSYSKIVQVSAKQKKTPQDFHLLGRAQPILSKDSASERKDEVISFIPCSHAATARHMGKNEHFVSNARLRPTISLPKQTKLLKNA